MLRDVPWRFSCTQQELSITKPSSQPPLHKSFPVAFGSGWAGGELRAPCPTHLHRQHLLFVPQQALLLVSPSSFYVLYFFYHFEGWNLGLGLRFLGAAVIQIINCSSVCLTAFISLIYPLTLCCGQSLFLALCP